MQAGGKTTNSEPDNSWEAIKKRNPALYAKVMKAQTATAAAIKAGKIKPFKVAVAKVKPAGR